MRTVSAVLTFFTILVGIGVQPDSASAQVVRPNAIATLSPHATVVAPTISDVVIDVPVTVTMHTIKNFPPLYGGQALLGVYCAASTDARGVRLIDRPGRNFDADGYAVDAETAGTSAAGSGSQASASTGVIASGGAPKVEFRGRAAASLAYRGTMRVTLHVSATNAALPVRSYACVLTSAGRVLESTTPGPSAGLPTGPSTNQSAGIEHFVPGTFRNRVAATNLSDNPHAIKADALVAEGNDAPTTQRSFKLDPFVVTGGK